jgi:UDP-galactopyranose mutase
MYDFLIIGSGLFGSVFARNAAERGHSSLVIDKRNHIGGNCYTENIEGINVHKYGPHIFHTNNNKVWKFVNRFSEFNGYQHHGRVKSNGQVFSFPINLLTLNQLWGVQTPGAAAERLEEVKIPCSKSNPNLEDWILSQVGEELYEKFVKGYTTKQWGRPPSELPSFIIKRLPIRLNYDDRYFNDKYQGIPSNGYTAMFENMIDHEKIEIQTNVDYFENRKELDSAAKKIIFTGMPDKLFDYRHGELEYRSLKFSHEIVSEFGNNNQFAKNGNFQGCSVMNYTDEDIPYTRIVEHKHFEFKESKKSVITHEYPDTYDKSKTPYYPVRDSKNVKIYEKYKKQAKESNIILGGRLGSYMYYDMHQVIAQALSMSDKLPDYRYM